MHPKVFTIIISLMLVVFAFDPCLGQYEAGYVVTNTGDTISGFISNKMGSKNFGLCSFKKQAGESSTEYKPEDLKAYSMKGGSMMISHEVHLHDEAKVVFLEVLTSGRVTLYRYFDNSTNYFFVDKSGTDFQALSNDLAEVNRNGKVVQVRTNQFKTALILMLWECTTIQKPLQEIELKETKLTKLIGAYNVCVEPSLVRSKKKRAFPTFGLMGGQATSNLVDNSNDYYGPYESTTASQFGFTIDFELGRKRNNQSFSVDFLYFNPHYVGYTPKTTVYREVEVKQLKFPFTFKQGLTRTKLRPYLFIGFSLSYMLYHKGTIGTVGLPQAPTTENTYPISPVAYMGGAGLTFPANRRIKGFLEFRFETNQITNLTFLGGIRL